MTKSLRLALLCAFLAPPATARAQATVRLDGTCERLVVAGQDLSGSCAGRLTNAVSGRRARFDFATTDGRTLSFAGDGARQEAGEETDPLQPINSVLVDEGAPTLAIGACRFTVPKPGRTAVACEARAADGSTFAATFVAAAEPAPATSNR